MKRSTLLMVIILLICGVFYIALNKKNVNKQGYDPANVFEKNTNEGGPEAITHQLMIEELRKQSFPGSEITIEQTLEPGSNYDRYIASYKSDGLKQYGLLTIPHGEKPSSGWPVIIFNHGFIPPAEYRTTERYIAYTDGFSRNGYILFRPDYRGHGNSEGTASGGYGSNGYTIDVLNAVSSIKKLTDPKTENKQIIIDPNRIGMWGHSMGGFITLRSMVVTKDIKAGVIWAGVVASYPDLVNNWRRGGPTLPIPSGARRWRQALMDQYGTPEKNPKFWNSISATSYLHDVSGPIQIHHGTADTSVPYQFSVTLDSLLKNSNKSSELYIYQGDDHNIATNFNLAMQRSIDYFDKHVKGSTSSIKE